ncbi:MAG: hypothetical protein EON54_04305 [Alcaligenaceae bacterium]|nr:MAG: hypothetical protein EON54_04305 [Alcaligenaceae bacterium]
MIHELREYLFAHSNWPAYERLFRGACWHLRRNDFGELLGAWTTQHNDNTVGFLHLWAYDSLDTRARLRADLLAKPRWNSEFIELVKPLMLRQRLSVFNPAPFYPSSALPSTGFLHRISCSVGKATQVVSALQAQSPLVWTTEFSDPNEVACITAAQACVLVDGPSSTTSEAVKTVRTTPLQAFVHP